MAKDLSTSDIRSLLQDALNQGLRAKEAAWIRDVYPMSGRVVYRLEQTDPYKELALYERNYMITFDSNDAVSVTLTDPVQVMQVTSYEPVVKSKAAFSAQPGGKSMVGKIFAVGEYPDKDFALTLEEAIAAQAAFAAPVSLTIEHIDSPLNGKLGSLTSFTVSETGDLIGTATVPDWVSGVLGTEFAISTEWNRDTKQLVGASIVLDPRVADAKLAAMSASFAQASRVGDPTRKEETDMDKKIVIMKKLWEKVDQATFTEDEKAAVEAELAGADPVQFARSEREIGAEAAALGLKADSFVDAALAENRITPAGKDALRRLFCASVRADAAGNACFSTDGALVVGDQTTALKEFVASLPQHKFTSDSKAEFSIEESDATKDEVEGLKKYL